MLSLPEIVLLLRDRRPGKIAKACGMTYAQVWRIASGKTKMINPEIHARLSNYFLQQK
jgi:hypothetical protein